MKKINLGSGLHNNQTTWKTRTVFTLLAPKTVTLGMMCLAINAITLLVLQLKFSTFSRLLGLNLSLLLSSFFLIKSFCDETCLGVLLPYWKFLSYCYCLKWFGRSVYGKNASNCLQSCLKARWWYNAVISPCKLIGSTYTILPSYAFEIWAPYIHKVRASTIVNDVFGKHNTQRIPWMIFYDFQSVRLILSSNYKNVNVWLLSSSSRYWWMYYQLPPMWCESYVSEYRGIKHLHL